MTGLYLFTAGDVAGLLVGGVIAGGLVVWGVAAWRSRRR